MYVGGRVGKWTGQKGAAETWNISIGNAVSSHVRRLHFKRCCWKKRKKDMLDFETVLLVIALTALS